MGLSCAMWETQPRDRVNFMRRVRFAIEYALPILFVIEDNGYGISTPTAGRLAFHFGIFPQQRIQKVNGRIVEEVYTVSGELIERTRRGGGPSLLWCNVDRLTHTPYPTISASTEAQTN